MQSNGQVGSSADGYWSYLERTAPGLTIDSLSFYVKGSSGRSVNASQGLRVCNANVCGAMIEPSSESVADYIKLPRGSPSIPEGSTHVRIGGKCLGSGVCGPTKPVQISNLEIQYLDINPPILEVDESQTDLIKNEWNSGEKYFVFTAEDPESGIFYTDVTRTQIEPLVFEDCGIVPYWPRTYSLMCPTNAANWVPMIDPYRSIWAEGQNTITLTARDSARNVTQLEYPFKLDRVAPVVGPDLIVDGINGDGWVHTPSVDVSWGNWGDSFENETESGIASATYWAQASPFGVDDETLWGEVREPGVSSIDQIDLPHDGIWSMAVQTFDGAGNASTGMAGRVLKRDTTKLNAPQIDSVGWIGPRNVSDDIVWQRPSNSSDSISGICGYALRVDDFSQSSPGETINVDGDVTTANLPYGTDDGPKWIHLRAITCAGLPGAISHSFIGVDTTRPDASLVAIDSAWHTAASPAVITSSDDHSGVDHIVYWIDGGPEIEVDGPTATVPLTDGVHELEFFARDAAGNRSAARKIEVLFDTSPPTTQIQLGEASDPSVVQGVAIDATAGIARAWLEYRREGDSGSWTPLAFVNVSSDPQPRTFVAGRFPDDEAEPGVYELRLIAEDGAGNTTTGSTRIDGSRAVLNSPLRVRPHLTAGFVSSNALESQKLVAFGAKTVLAGRLALPDGAPIPDGRIEVFSQVARSQLVRPFATTTTAQDGRFLIQVPAGPTRQFTVRSAGTKTLLSARADANLLTKASAKLTARPRSVRGGRPVTIRGRLALGGVQLGNLGKQVAIEVRVGNRWTTLATVTASGNGAFGATWTPRRVRRPVRFAIRASVPRASDWPYEKGSSRTSHVVVKP